jgi:signal transduction histidine kinase/CheY-like chemotaxis protein
MSTGSPHAGALLALGRRLISERDPASLLPAACAAARELTGARLARVTVTRPNGEIERIIVDPPSGGADRVPDLDEHERARIVARQTVVTGGAPPTRGEATEPRHPSRIVTPLATPHFVYGWLTLIDKPGGFEKADEQVALTISGLAATAYENAALIAREEDMEFALSVAHLGLSYRDTGSQDILISRSLADLLGLPPGTRSISRTDFLQRVHPDDAARVDATVRDAVSRGTEFHLEYRLHAGERGWRWFRSTGRVRVNMQGQPRVFSGITDVTERRSLEAQLQHAQKMEALGQLAGGVAHDFNNFITAILGYARFLLESASDPSRQRDAEEIVKAAERAASLTKQLLAFGRRHVMEMEVVDVNARVLDIADMLTRIIGEDVPLTTRLHAEVPAVRVGRGQLEQIVMNLVVNARAAIEGGGSISIETANAVFDRHTPIRPPNVPPGRYVVIGVSDTGCGMTEETKARLFEPFFTTKPRDVGSGLGLATVYGIVAQCGGAITVTSEPGQGSTFQIYLPRHDHVVSEPAPAPEVTGLHGGETVLLAEDEPAVRRLARVILERAGYRVVEAGNPDEAEAAAESLSALDLLLTDVVMPGGTGPDLFRRLSLRRPGIRVVFMSGYAEQDLFDRDTLGQSVAFVAKPFSAAGLVATVRSTLDA